MSIASSNRRPILALYSGEKDPFSHQIRIVLAEKHTEADIINIVADNLPEDFVDLNPYNTIPTLTDRDLVLYESHIIMEYLDERYPHPPLMPAFPIGRAKLRLLLHRIRHEWYSLLDTILHGQKAEIQSARQELTDILYAAIPFFNQSTFFMSEDFSLLDCYILPLLWRLSIAGIKLSEKAVAITKYTDRMFARPSFIASLTKKEKEMQKNPIHLSY